jgi:uncharacterized membrane protein
MARSRASAALALGALLIAAASVRFWRLDVPPAWLDEAVTALIAAGRGPDRLPVGTVLPLARIGDVFSPQVDATAGDALAVFRDPRVQDLHPPTFHLMSNAALRAGIWPHASLVGRVRALAAAIGLLAVAAMYLAARQAFDRATALLASALAAVSPYPLMLSREARNYSLAMLLVTLSLAAALALARRMDRRTPARGWWLAWIAFSAAGLYVHNFVLFAWVAQSAVLMFIGLRAKFAIRPLLASVGAVAVLFAPWVRTLLAQQASTEQQWLRFELSGHSVTDVPYRLASTVQTMLLGKAWDAGDAVYATSRVAALIMFVAIIVVVARAFRAAPHDSAEARTARLLAALVAITLLEYFAATVAQQKDFSAEPRYQFSYYPPLVLMIAWAFAQLRREAAGALVAVALLNGVMVDLDVESWKGSDATPVIARFLAAAPPTLIVAGVGSFNEVVIHATLWNEFIRRAGSENRSVAFVTRTHSYASLDVHADPSTFWNALARLRPPVMPASMLIYSGGMLARDYRRSVTVTTASGASVTCAGVLLGDPANATDHAMERPAYRRYQCGASGTDGSR